MPLLTLWSVVFVAMSSDISWRHCLQLVVLLLPPLRFTDCFSLMIGPAKSNSSLDRNTSLFASDFLDESRFTAFK